MRASLLRWFIALALFAPGTTAAQNYPSQDIRLICAFPAGGGADVLVRHFAEKLRPIAGRTVIVENKAGAGGNIATEYVARAKPDGYTIYVHAGSAVAANQSLFKKPPVDVLRDIRVVATINRQPFMLVVDAKSPYKTVADLTAAMKQKGDKASYATAANPGRIMGAIYSNTTGIKAVEVQYRSAPDSLNELANGKLDYGMHDPIFALAQARANRVRILAVSTKERLLSQPDIPTMTESGVPMDLSLWWGVMVPVATPKPIVDKINAWFGQIVGTEETKKFLADAGADPMINTPERATEMFQTAIREWGEYVRMAKIEPM